MKDFLEAAQIFLKRGNREYCFSAEHDEIYIHYDPAEFDPVDVLRLEELGFHAGDHNFYFFP